MPKKYILNFPAIVTPVTEDNLLTSSWAVSFRKLFPRHRGKGSMDLLVRERLLLFYAWWYRTKVVPVWNCSPQGLWVILSSWVMISVERHFCRVFEMCLFCFFLGGPCEHHKPIDISFHHISEKADICMSWFLPNLATRTETIWLEEWIGVQIRGEIFGILSL